MLNHFRFKNAGRSSRYRNMLLIYTLIPVLSVTLLFLILDNYLLRRGNEAAFLQCSQELSNVGESYTRELAELSKNSLLLMNSDSFCDVLFSDTALSPENKWKLTECCDLLKSYVNTKDYISGAGFISEADNLFVASSGTVSLDLFFRSEKYGTLITGPDFLNTYSRRSSVLQIQPVDHLETGNGDHTAVIPVFQFNLGTVDSHSPLIITLNQQLFAAALQNSLPTANSILCIVNQTDGSLLASTAEGFSLSSLPETAGQLPDWYAEKLHIPDSVGNYYGFTASASGLYSDQLGFLLLVPKSELLGMTMNSFLVSVIILSLCCLLGFAACYLISLKVYSPISKIVRQLEKSAFLSDTDQTQAKDEMAYLNDHVGSLLTSHETLRQTITTALPTLHAQYILNILHQEEYDNLQLEPILEKYPFHFPWPYFTAALLHVRLLHPFYTDFSDDDRSKIQHMLTDILGMNSETDYTKYVFRVRGKSFCVIFNTKSENAETLIRSDFAKLKERFAFDEKYIQLYLAAGSTGQGLKSLHDSYRKARIAISDLSLLTESCCIFFQTPAAQKNKYFLDASQENMLSSNLMQGNEQTVLTLTAEIISANQKAGVSEGSLRDLFVDLYQIGKKAADRLGLDYTGLLQDEYTSLPDFLNSMNNLQRASYLTLFFQTVCRNIPEKLTAHISAAQLREYIDTHFTEDLYLEMLADQYHTSPKYMSKLLKNALGIPFKQYLNALRIQHSKKLLLETGLRIEDIALQSGFNGRNTFIRLFKSMEGMTPSEYRKLQAENAIFNPSDIV